MTMDCIIYSVVPVSVIAKYVSNTGKKRIYSVNVQIQRK